MSEISREVTEMPGRDGTGPAGAGALTGRGLGPCAGTRMFARGAGCGFGAGMGLAQRRGFRGGFCRDCTFERMSEKEMLLDQKNRLQRRLNAIEKQLGND